MGSSNRPDAAVAAIKYALNNRFDDPLDFLTLWMEGAFSTIREEWPDAPDEIFIGADPLHSQEQDGLLEKEHW